MSKKLISVILALTMVVGMFTVALVSTSAETLDEVVATGDATEAPTEAPTDKPGGSVPETTVAEAVPEGTETYRYYFALPDEWKNSYSSIAGIYWWEGTAACASWPGYRAMPSDIPGVFYADVPTDVTVVIWSNCLDGGTDTEAAVYNLAAQTKNIGSEYYDAGYPDEGIEPEDDNYPDGTENFDGMIFIANLDESVAEVSPLSGKLSYNGEWFSFDPETGVCSLPVSKVNPDGVSFNVKDQKTWPELAGEPTEPDAPTEPDTPTEPDVTEVIKPTDVKPTSPVTPSGSTIKVGGVEYPVSVGDEITYTFYMNLGSKHDGIVENIFAEGYYDKSMLEYVNITVWDDDEEDYVTDYNTLLPELVKGGGFILNTSIPGEFYIAHSNFTSPAQFNTDESVLCSLKFKVIGEGNSEITTGIKDMTYCDATAGSGEPIVRQFKVIVPFYALEVLDVPAQPTEPEKPTEPIATEPEPTEPEPTQPEPTEPEPTEPEPTEPEPTQPEPTEPGDETVIVTPDGRYPVHVGDVVTYTYYLNVHNKIENMETWVYFDSDKLQFMPYEQYDSNGNVILDDAGLVAPDMTKTFPQLSKIGGIVFNYSKYTPGSELEDGQLAFNCTDMMRGYTFKKDTHVLCHLQFKVIAPGEASINAPVQNMTTLGGVNGDCFSEFEKADGIYTFQTIEDITPEPTEPIATEPIATEPEPTEPIATEPEATEPEPTEPPTEEPTPSGNVYTAVGAIAPAHSNGGVFGTAWDPANTDNDLVYDAETGLWSIKYTNVPATGETEDYDDTWYEYKVAADHAWTFSYNEQGLITGAGTNAKFDVEVDGSTVEIFFDGEKCWAVVTPPTPVPTEPIATEPEPTEPIATEPEPTEPIATEPEATEPEPTEPPTEEPTPSGNVYTAVGAIAPAHSNGGVFGTAWDPENTDNDLVYNPETQLWSIKYTNVPATGETEDYDDTWYEYKVAADHAWTFSYNEQGLITGAGTNAKFDVEVDGSTVEIFFDGEKCWAVVTAPTPVPTEPIATEPEPTEPIATEPEATEPEPTQPPTEEPTPSGNVYTAVGAIAPAHSNGGVFGTAWDPENTDNDLVYNPETQLWSIKYTNVPATGETEEYDDTWYEYKVAADHAWTFSYNEQGLITGAGTNAKFDVEVDGSTVEIFFDGEKCWAVVTAPTPVPTEPIATEPEPTQPEPTQPEPTQPEPTQPEPTQPEPTQPEPTQPEPTQPEPTQPEPTQPEPTQPEPTEVAPTEVAPTEVAPTEVTPTEIAPTEAVPTEVAPTDAAPATADQKPTDANSSNSGTSNNAVVKTGATQMAIIFLVVLIAAAGVIVFTRKKVTKK